jgi:hypothetical protein
MTCENTFLSAQIFLNGDQAEVVGVFTVDLNDDDAELSSPIAVGQHILRYTYVDACGNSDFIDIPSFDAIVTDEFACDLITINTSVDTIEAVNAPDACFTLRVNYDVINFCEYNSLGEAYLIPRDGDGIRNPATQLLYLNVIANDEANTSDDIAFLSRFTDRNFDPNAPQRDQLVDDGDDNDGSDDDNGNDSEETQAANGVGFAYTQDDSRGFFRYIQYIDIYDEDAPAISGDVPADCFAGSGEGCEAEVTLTFTATDECTTPIITVELDRDYNAANGFIPNGDVPSTNDGPNYTVNLSNVPVGTHAIRIRANDGCGNFDVEVIEFCVIGDKAPTPICIQTLTVTLMPDGNGGGMAAIWASDFIASDVEDCFGNVIDQYSIYTEEEVGDAGFAVNTADIGIEVTCDDLGNLPVRVYAIAANGTADYCSVVVDVQAFQEGLCDDNGGNLAGIIMTEELNTVENVVVTLEGAADFTATMTTTDNGAFLFTGLDQEVDYTITPTHYTDYMNGVRTSDIVGITQHILGVQLLSSPYKYIAADVDGNEEVNVGDIINIRRLILGLSDTYPNGMPSWAFVSADYEFSTLDNPWAEAFPSVLNINNLTANVTDADFVGVKLGDVNGTAIANVMQPLAPRNLRGSLDLELDEIELIQGETYTIPVTAPNLDAVDGYQFTFEFDRAAVTIEGIEPGLIEQGNFGWRFANQGLITTSWNWEGGNAPANWSGDEVLFSLVVRAEANGKLSEVLEAGSRYTEAEAYVTGSENLQNLSLVFNEDIVEVAGYRLLQNIPNPVRKETTIGYELPEAHAKVTITITDAAGRIVREFTQEGVVGYNSVRVTKRQLGGASGVYSYTVSAGDWVASKRMVIIE